MVEAVDRDRILAYRAAAQGLHRERDDLDLSSLAVLDLGVQDTPAGSAAVAVAVRGATLPADPAEAGTAMTWTLRGAPHLHRADELRWWSHALWPWSDDDALARFDTSSSNVRATGLSAREALRFVAEQVAQLVTEPTPKGEVSTALTPLLPPELTVDCRSCEATHIVETLWRSSILPAGITFAPRVRAVTFVPSPSWPGVPSDTRDDARLVRTYLRLHGPAGPAEVAAFLGTRRAELEPRWPTGLAEVDLHGARRWIDPDALPLVTSPPDPPLVRLLPASDPWLQARDRELVVPDRSAREKVWPVLGRPGVVLVRGEVVGVWRARRKGRRLELTVEGFGRLPASVRRHLDDEAQLVARARGAREASLTVT